MTIPVMPEGPGTSSSSTRPYLIRALHDWCTDNGFTPYLAVFVDSTVQVPGEYVKNSEIVLNTSFEATSGLQLGNEFISFKARFGGTAREIVVPIDHVIAIYARENGQGMAFPAPTGVPNASGDTDGASAGSDIAATTARGTLRLATTSEAASRDVADTGAPTNPDSDQPEPPPGNDRPSLKRVK